MRIRLVLHHDREDALELGRRLSALASSEGLEVVAAAGDAGRLGVEAEEPANSAADVVVAVGGDGTVLEGARIALRSGAALLGINAGRVGFLADVEPAGLDAAVRALASGSWNTQAAMTVEATMPNGGSAIGMNDVVIEKVASHRLVSISLAADGRDVATYHADGVVICTPTGSTAYNLSAGGPLVDRRIEALIVTPVASHSLFSKTLVFSPAVRLVCRVVDERPVGVSVDGRQVGTLSAGEQVEIARGTDPVRMINLSGQSFDQVLRRKFSLTSERQGEP